MKPQIYVLIALMLSLLVVGLILILGFASRTMLPVYLLVFLLVLFALTIFLLKNMFSNKMIILGSIILILIAISATLFLTNLKIYYDVVNTYSNLENSPEIKLIQSQNDYYYAYANYLNQMISDYQNKSKILQNQLAELNKAELAAANQQTNNIASPTLLKSDLSETSYITYSSQEKGELNDD